MIDTVLFDLDGTLSDSAPGILGSLRSAFNEFELGWPDEATARSLLGPPFWHSLVPLIGSVPVADVIAAYRRYYVEGGRMFQTQPYPGVAELLKQLSVQAISMAVATSKPESHAIRIVEALGLSEHFQSVAGDTVDGQRDSKAAVVGEVLDRLGNPVPETVLMVGDRSHDVLGAAAHDVRCAGVLWGYGTVQELNAAGAVALLSSPDELIDLIG